MVNMADRPPSLHDYLIDQLGWFDLEPELRQMCERLIYSLDTNGYLKTNLEELVDPTGGPEQVKLAQRALAVLQKLDPPGVAAHDLRECLLLQLTTAMPYYEQLRTIISAHLEDLEHNRLPAIERKTGYSLDLIQKTIAELKKLKPKPGADFNNEHVPNVTPCSWKWARTANITSAWRTAARRVCASAAFTSNCYRTGRPRSRTRNTSSGRSTRHSG
jgi:RNA polymerase sigma-54 factor